MGNLYLFNGNPILYSTLIKQPILNCLTFFGDFDNHNIYIVLKMIRTSKTSPFCGLTPGSN